MITAACNAARMMVSGGQLLTTRQVAETLNVSAHSVLRWARRGDLPAFKLPGGAIRYRRDELEAWLESRATRA